MSDPPATGFGVCPSPASGYDRIVLGHGSGGRLSANLLRDVFLPGFGNEVLSRLEDAGCARYVVTDVTKDGTLRGPNIDLLRQMCERTDKPVVASGGISSLDDLRALRELVPIGVEGAIVGKALYAGKFTLPEALDVAGRR